MVAFPAIKFFSPDDQSQDFPYPIECVRVDKQVMGVSWSDWHSWFRLARLLDAWPF
jgi:hypothetical protein